MTISSERLSQILLVLSLLGLVVVGIFFYIVMQNGLGDSSSQEGSLQEAATPEVFLQGTGNLACQYTFSLASAKCESLSISPSEFEPAENPDTPITLTSTVQGMPAKTFDYRFQNSDPGGGEFCINNTERQPLQDELSAAGSAGQVMLIQGSCPSGSGYFIIRQTYGDARMVDTLNVTFDQIFRVDKRTGEVPNSIQVHTYFYTTHLTIFEGIPSTGISVVPFDPICSGGLIKGDQLACGQQGCDGNDAACEPGNVCDASGVCVIPECEYDSCQCEIPTWACLEIENTPVNDTPSRGDTLNYRCAYDLDKVAGDGGDAPEYSNFRVLYSSNNGDTWQGYQDAETVPMSGTIPYTTNFDFTVPADAEDGDYLVQCQFCNTISAPGGDICSAWGKTDLVSNLGVPDPIN